MARSMRERAVDYCVGILRRASDWQDGQTALADHDEFGPWLLEIGGDEMGAIVEAQNIVREAEERLGDEVPY